MKYTYSIESVQTLTWIVLSNVRICNALLQCMIAHSTELLDRIHNSDFEIMLEQWYANRRELTISVYAGVMQDVVNYPYPTTDIGF